MYFKYINNVNVSYEHSTTALMIAAVMDDAEALNKLLQKGADISAKHDSGKTSLDYANLYDSKECIKVLQAAQKSRRSQRVKHQTQFFSPCPQPAVNESNEMHVSKRVCG